LEDGIGARAASSDAADEDGDTAMRFFDGFTVDMSSTSIYYVSALFKGIAMVQFEDQYKGGAGTDQSSFKFGISEIGWDGSGTGGTGEGQFEVGKLPRWQSTTENDVGTTYNAGTKTYDTNTTYFLVAKIDAGTDEIFMKVYDETMSLDTSEVTVWDYADQTGASDYNQDAMTLWFSDHTPGEVDEIRVGETWQDVVPSTGPARPVLDIDVQNGNAVLSIVGLDAGSSNTMERAGDLGAVDPWAEVDTFVAQGSETNWTDSTALDQAFYRLQTYELPPMTFLDEDFESGASGWTEGGSGTEWALGTPTTGPGAANSGSNAYATNLDGNYENNTDRYLRSPAIDLTTASAAFVTWFEAYDLEPGYDYAYLNVLDTNLTVLASEIYTANGYGALSWTQRQMGLPDTVLGQPVILEFRLTADGFDPVALGWYIDDVVVREP
jgi:hypothetical protein